MIKYRFVCAGRGLWNGRAECKNQLCPLMKDSDLSARVLIYTFNSASCFPLHLLQLKLSDVNVNRHEQKPCVLKSLDLLYL